MTNKMIVGSQQQAIDALLEAWPLIVDETLDVLGSELHYQAMIYHCFRQAGVSKSQLGMNVKMWIPNPTTELFQSFDKRKHKDFQGGFETIPDVVIFNENIHSDWRRRNREATLKQMLLGIEVKASERRNSRLQPSEVILDIKKLAAHRDEAEATGAGFLPVMMVIDSAPIESERMTSNSLEKALGLAKELNVSFLYASKSDVVTYIAQ